MPEELKNDQELDAAAEKALADHFGKQEPAKSDDTEDKGKDDKGQAQDDKNQGTLEEQLEKWKFFSKKNEDSFKKVSEDLDKYKADAEAWRKYQEDQLPADEKAKREFDDLKKELQELKTEKVRDSVIISKNVPAAAHIFLTGTTKEELEQQADSIMAIISESKKPSAPRPQDSQGQAKEKEPQGSTLADFFKSKKE